MKTGLTTLLLACLLAASSFTQTLFAQCAQVSTLAGNGTFGYVDATGANARFGSPYFVTADAAGNIYVSDNSNFRIRKVTPAGVVTTFAGVETAGYTDGDTSVAEFSSSIAGLAIDSQGNLFVADASNNCIRKITPAGMVSTFAGNASSGNQDGSATAARFNFPFGLTIDTQDNLYVADMVNHSIRKITPAGAVTTLAGNGTTGDADATGSDARFDHPHGLTVDANGNVYVADLDNFKIRKITPEGVVTTVAGSGTRGFVDGAPTEARFDNPVDVVVDALGNLYVTDKDNFRIRKINPEGMVSSIAGNGTQGLVDGADTAARFDNSYGITLDASGNLYTADLSGFAIRRISFADSPSAPTVADTTRCGSGNVVFTATNTLGTSEVVEWSTDASTWGNAGSTSPEYNVEMGTPITRYARVRNTETGCASATTTVTGTGNAFPAIPTITQADNSLESSYATGNQWLDGNMDAIAGATDPTFAPTASGTYFVRHTDGNNCAVISEGFAFITTSRLAAGSLAFALYPNPATASCTVQASNPATYHLRVVNTTGEVVRQAIFSGTSYTLNTQSLAKGVYSVQLQSSAGNAVQRVVVQ